MTNRTTHIRFGWLLAFSFLFTFIAGSGSAADLADATQVALRPGSSSMPPASTPTDWNNPGFPTDLLRPDLLHGPPTTPPANDRQNEIGRRYQDSRMLGFLQTTNMNQIASLYAEASRMIDSRHVNPVSYEERTRAGLGGLVEALNNPAFLQAAGYRSAANTQALQNELMQLANSPARSANDAVGLMQYAAELANRRLGLRREAVALEFFNASLDSLDKYSAFVPARTGRRPGAGLEEQMVGIGVELKKHDSGAPDQRCGAEQPRVGRSAAARRRHRGREQSEHVRDDAGSGCRPDRRTERLECLTAHQSERGRIHRVDAPPQRVRRQRDGRRDDFRGALVMCG